MKRLEIEGQKFGKLTAVRKTGKRGLWLFKCDCGKEIEVCAYRVRSGNTQSCGCLKTEMLILRATHNMSNTKLFQRWAGMIQRCTNPNHVGYKNYGAKGIKVCERWMSFENFIKDMGEPEEGQTIDRIDSNGNYCPENCRWASPREQSRNTKRNVFVTIDGETMTIRDWEIEKEVKRGLFQSRIDRGWPPEKAVTESVRPGVPLRRRAA